MPNKRQQERLKTIRRSIVKAKEEAGVFINLIAQYRPRKDAREFASLIKANHQFFIKIELLLAQFDEWQVSSPKAGETPLEAAEEHLRYAWQFDALYKLTGLWNELLVNMKDLLQLSPLNDYTKESPGDKRTIRITETGLTINGVTDYDKKNCATNALGTAEKNIKQISIVMSELRDEQYARMSLTDIKPVLISAQQEKKIGVTPLSDGKKSDIEDGAALLDKQFDSLRQSLPSQREQKPDTWVSAALLDSKVVTLIHESMQRIPSGSWPLQLRNGFIEAVSPVYADKSFAGTNQQCRIALAGLKLLPEIVADGKENWADKPKGSLAKSQHYNSACTADLEMRLISIADATESLVEGSPATEEIRSLRKSYLDNIKQLNLETLFEQLNEENAPGKIRKFSFKDWITQLLFTGAKGWAIFYKEYQRQYPVLSKYKEIARRIKQAAEIMANYLREAQKIAAGKGKPFKIKDVAKEESRLISEHGRAAFISLFDYAGSVFADCQMPIGTNTTPSSNRGSQHDGYANFMKTCLYRYERGDSELLFQGYRHSAAPPIDLKNEKDKIKKTVANIKTGLVQQFADTLQQRINSGDLILHELEKKHGKEATALPMAVASLSLLTPEYSFLKPFHDKGSNNAQLAMIDNAFAQIDGKPLQVRLKDGHTIYVRPDICLMNAPTNHLGGIHYYSPEDFNNINQRGFAKLISRIQRYLSSEKFRVRNDEIKIIKQKFEVLLDAKPAQRQKCVDEVKKTINDFWRKVGDKIDPVAKEQCNFLQLAVEIIEIYSRGLRENAFNMSEFQACFMMLNYMMGDIVEMYCKSGKDRTGAIDETIKAKHLSRYDEGANGRFSSYRPLSERVEYGLSSTTYRFIDGPLTTIQRCGSSPFSAGENTYGARNLQRNKFLLGFASGGQTPIDLALAKLNKKPFSLANAKAGKKVIMALGSVLLLAPALIYWAGQFINYHLIQRPMRFYRAHYGNVSLKMLAARGEPKVKAIEKDILIKKERSHFLFSIDTMLTTIVAREKTHAARKRAQSDDTTPLLTQPQINEAQTALRETMVRADQKIKARVTRLNVTASPSNDALGKAQIILRPLSDEMAEARAFVDTIDSRQNVSIAGDIFWRQALTDTCKDINHYFASLVSGRNLTARVTSHQGHVFVGELFGKNTSKRQAKQFKPAGNNGSNAYDKVQESLIELVVLSSLNSGVTQNAQGAYGVQQPDGEFVPATLQLIIGKNFDDGMTLRIVLAIMWKVRELLEQHNISVGQEMPVELVVIDQRDDGKSAPIYFSEKGSYQKIQALAPNGLGRLASKADARENQIRQAFSKFNLALELPSKQAINRP